MDSLLVFRVAGWDDWPVGKKRFLWMAKSRVDHGAFEDMAQQTFQVLNFCLVAFSSNSLGLFARTRVENQHRVRDIVGVIALFSWTLCRDPEWIVLAFLLLKTNLLLLRNYASVGVRVGRSIPNHIHA